MTNNDTSTLNGALQELGETMAENLTTMGVPSTYDEGLTTLANRILEIAPVPPTPTPASITLSCDKPIMMTGETATITATVLDANDNPCEGETVSFEVVDGEDLGTATTDSSGECSVYYLGEGTGDLYIRAECGIILSEIYSLEDCTFTYLEEYVKTSSVSTDTVTAITNEDFSSLSDFTLSFDIKGDESKVCGLFNGTGSNINYYVGFGLRASSLIQCMYRTTSSNHTNSSVYASDTYHTVKLVKQGTSLQYYVDDSLVTTKTIDWTSSYPLTNLGVLEWNSANSSIYVKNIKVKPL